MSKYSAKRIVNLIAALGVVTLGFSGVAQAQFPDKPIQFISPFAAGGANDYLTRLMAQHMGPILKTTIVVENKSGANGIVGATFVAKAAPDGYTVLMGNSATQGTNPSLYPNTPYDAIKDFAPISMVGFVPLVMVVDPRLGINTVAELLAYAKKNPGKVAFSSSGIGSTGHLAGEAFKAASGIDMIHAPYKGDAPAIGDVAAGQIALSFVGVASATSLYKGGKVKVLGVASSRRSSSMPDVPTFAEAGYKIEVSQWYGLFARAGTPPATIEKMNAAAKVVLARPEIKEAIVKQGAEPEYSSPAQLGSFAQSEIERFGAIIKRLGIKVQ
jgi:tripartite-type tricarboxylate transporter receptor subunit TctC